jgi:hypothetical protein
MSRQVSLQGSAVGAVYDRAYSLDSGKTARSYVKAARYRACASPTAPTVCENPERGLKPPLLITGCALSGLHSQPLI